MPRGEHETVPAQPLRVGRIVLHHPFVVPGTVAIVVTIALGFLLAPLVV